MYLILIFWITVYILHYYLLLYICIFLKYIFKNQHIFFHIKWALYETVQFQFLSPLSASPWLVPSERSGTCSEWISWCWGSTPAQPPVGRALWPFPPRARTTGGSSPMTLFEIKTPDGPSTSQHSSHPWWTQTNSQQQQ